MPPWFEQLVGQIESLSMDNRADRERLWEVMCANWPKDKIEEAIYKHTEDEPSEWQARRMARHARRSVIEALEGR